MPTIVHWTGAEFEDAIKVPTDAAFLVEATARGLPFNHVYDGFVSFSVDNPTLSDGDTVDLLSEEARLARIDGVTYLSSGVGGDVYYAPNVTYLDALMDALATMSISPWSDLSPRLEHHEHHREMERYRLRDSVPRFGGRELRCIRETAGVVPGDAI